MKIEFYTYVQWHVLIFLMMGSLNVSCQCREDLYGAWTSVDGKKIDMMLEDEKTGTKYSFCIGNKEKIYSVGFSGLSHSMVTLTHSDYGNKQFDKISFQFQVLSLDKQAMRIQPISQAMISLFGNKNVILFNDNFIPYDKVTIDSFAYRDHLGTVCLQINKSGMMKLQRDYPTYHRRRKYYVARLNETQFSELKEKVLYSLILNLSECELTDMYIDTSPFWLTIVHNGKTTSYCKSFPERSIIPLMNFLYGTLSKTKWKKIKRKHARLDKAFDFI